MGAHETGKQCDGCGAPRGTVPLFRHPVKEGSYIIVMTYCRACRKGDAEINRMMKAARARNRRLPPTARSGSF